MIRPLQTNHLKPSLAHPDGRCTPRHSTILTTDFLEWRPDSGALIENLRSSFVCHSSWPL